MSEPVLVIGTGAGELPPGAAEAVRRATFLAGGKRHLRLAGPTAAETFAITDNVEALVDRLRARRHGERCVVLASGDPLFFGIGRRLIEALGATAVRVEPAVSSVQLAFARVGLPWADAAVGTVHGRPLKPALLPLLGRPLIGLLTRDGAGPAEVARFLLDRGLDDYRAWVCENLGAADEAVAPRSLDELASSRFADLNVLVLQRPDAPLLPTDDANFDAPATGPVLLTHEDVRAVVVRRFGGLAEGPLWDVGAGLGGVTVDLARAFPAVEVVACESSADRIGFLRSNRRKFGAWNARVVEGEAPECLGGEDAPAGVFLGGSGGRLDAVLDLVESRLLPGGRFVGNFVGLENVARVLERFRAAGWPTALTQVQVAEGRPLAGLTTLVPQRPVWVVRADRPATGVLAEEAGDEGAGP